MQLLSTPGTAANRHSVPLFISLGSLPVGRTRNLSASGVFIETPARPPIASRHEMRLAWGNDTFACMARIVRHAEDGIGVAFEDADAFFAQAIAEILADTKAPPAQLKATPPAT